MIAAINRMSITSSTDTSVPVGSGGGMGSSSKTLPKKGGRSIHPADVIEMRGKLTPVQMHRMLVTMQQEEQAEPGQRQQSANDAAQYWSVGRVAAAFELDPAAVESMRRHLSLPYVIADEQRTYHGTVDIPANVFIQRSLGKTVETHILGEHLRLEASTPTEAGPAAVEKK